MCLGQLGDEVKLTAKLSACEIAFGGQMTTVSWLASRPASQPVPSPNRLESKECRITDFIEFYQMMQNTPTCFSLWMIRRTLQICLGQLLLSRCVLFIENNWADYKKEQ